MTFLGHGKPNPANLSRTCLVRECKRRRRAAKRCDCKLKSSWQIITAFHDNHLAAEIAHLKIGGKKWNQWVLNPCFHPSSSIPDATWAPWAKSFILVTLFCRNAKVQARRCSRILQQSLKLWPCSQRTFYVLQKHLSHRPVNPVCVQNDLAF